MLNNQYQYHTELISQNLKIRVEMNIWTQLFFQYGFLVLPCNILL
jgi:hypothetical protein